ncbi:chromosome transmission fidelity protein 18 homolog isoform X2 [Amborella trichopoda]|uniref:AAA+ ATPase domain-containing protein n=1 Tax=Amborella trichopoda TaxID=13333 RepID=W1P479_AMBTC|nr:chromosome transmission fidelity protein 18 homolog isoform X2 [Amborella trichopoda]ERN04662.1 hypothetical protein AMTR_s00076p00097050 [Amborella trichopoda]|eukprot:XP_006842987.3 chromosome transmission fidelity protein 18 homolog isoform X2 [Amborella trichopoda]
MNEEMDMDMPLQDELEWLEHCASHQYEEEYEEPEPDEPPSELAESILSPPALKKSVLLIGNVPENKQKSPEGNAGKEMDMAMPLSDKLEWLEHRASHHYEDFEEPEIEMLDNLPLPLQNQKKRMRSNGYEATNVPEKRKLSPTKAAEKETFSEELNKLPNLAEECHEDEDWLRYPKEGADDSSFYDGSVWDENWPSRFASEIEGDFVPITGTSGVRVYARLSKGEVLGFRNPSVERASSGLLSEPIRSLMEKVEQEALQKACLASTRVPDEEIHCLVPEASERLWVDKYAPSSFTELLSDEQTNREVLCWLKQWDPCVFGSQIRATPDYIMTSLRRHSSPSQRHSNKSSYSNKDRAPLREVQDLKKPSSMIPGDSYVKSISRFWNKRSSGNDRPEKVLLLCGPPGLGKTTLAHVAARHCGYRVVEVNASDDRSASTIEGKILDVVQMNSIMADSKPKCLIIDEIDGALGEGKGAIEVILKMLAAEKKSIAGKGGILDQSQPEKSSTRKGSPKTNKITRLSRPIICICNDLYTPALRPLRQIATVHTFVQPSISRVVKRLKYICKKEGFKTSALGLTALAEYTECDIRSCLNALQFLYKKKENLNTVDIGSQVIGRKDMSRSIFDVWKEVFQKRKVKVERATRNDCKNLHKDFDHLHDLISNHGDYELIMDGIYENFLNLHYHDALMEKTVKCLDILGVSDSFIQRILRTQQFSLHAYQASLAIAIRSFIAQVEKPTIEWPKSFQRSRVTSMEKKDLLKLWLGKISPSISRHFAPESFVQDASSLLLNILSPPTLRPVAMHLLSDRERDHVNNVVETMVSYSITYKNGKVDPPEGTQKYAATEVSTLCLDPPLGDFMKFKDHHPGHYILPLAVRQILVHEVEKHKLLGENRSRFELPSEVSVHESVPFPSKGDAKSYSTKASYAASPVETSLAKSENVRPRQQNVHGGISNNVKAVGLMTKTTGNAKKPVGGSNFFDRFRKSNCKGSQGPDASLPQSATIERDSRPLLFKFNEGFTNAVKRPVRVRELL